MEATSNSGRIDSRPLPPAAMRLGSRPRRSSPALTAWSDRWVGDAAAELRTPLSKIAESIRIVASGELGPVSRLQRDCLADATVACQRIDLMIGGLQRLNRQRSGRQGTLRCWFDLESLRQNVDRAIAQSLPHRHVVIHWHGMQSGQELVFADPSRVCLLLVGLLSSAIRRTPGTPHLLVRVTRAAANRTLRLTVVDHRAAGPADAQAIGEHAWGDRAESETADWQQLAAALLTDVSVSRRAGRGREISFELPVAGLRSVAIQWAKWRLRQSGRGKSRNAADSLCPAVQTDAGPLHADHAAVLTVKAGAAVAQDTVEVFDRKLQHDCREFDLVYRISPRCWVVVWDASVAQARARMEQLASAELDTASPLRLSWSPIGRVPIGEGQTACALADRLAREALSDAESGGFLVEPSAGDAEPLLALSTAPSDRLGAELKHLATRISAQNKLLQRQTLRHHR